MGVQYLGDVLEDLRDACEDGLDPVRTGNPAPDRVMVSHGAPAVDACDDGGLLAVYVERIEHVASKGSGRMPGACLIAATAVVAVELWRCVPSLDGKGHPLPASTYQDAALGLLYDAWALLGHLYDEWVDGNLGAPCRDVQIGTLMPLAPRGGAAGWLLRISYTLGDASTPAS